MISNKMLCKLEGIITLIGICLLVIALFSTYANLAYAQAGPIRYYKVNKAVSALLDKEGFKFCDNYNTCKSVYGFKDEISDHIDLRLFNDDEVGPSYQNPRKIPIKVGAFMVMFDKLYGYSISIWKAFLVTDNELDHSEVIKAFVKKYEPRVQSSSAYQVAVKHKNRYLRVQAKVEDLAQYRQHVIAYVVFDDTKEIMAGIREKQKAKDIFK